MSPLRPRDAGFEKIYTFTDKNGQQYDPWGLTGATFWNYYICYISVIVHLVVMTFGLDFWCNYSKLVLFYSF